jgi:uncharacterized membrane protein YfcA
VGTSSWTLAIAGLIVGFVVGLTGMGGGALMTPILILVFGVDPTKAVSSDLVVSLLMKPVAAYSHIRRKTVNWVLVKWLVIGSVPGAFVGVYVIKLMGDDEATQNFIKQALGVALLLSVTFMLGKAVISLRQYYRDKAAGIETSRSSVFDIVAKPVPTIIVGFLGGVIVGMTSVGSGSLIIVGLLLLYPLLRASDLVGTDLVQAIPLVGAAALGHVLIGDFDATTTVWLLVGALPGAFLGSRVSSRTGQAGIVRRALALVLLASGLKLLNVPPNWIVALLAAFLILGPVAWAITRNTEGFTRPLHKVEGVTPMQLVWAALTGVPPRYQRMVREQNATGAPEGSSVAWTREDSASDPL